jgi:MFS family permease
VYYSKLAGLVTPWRLGEYPSRALLRGEWKQTLSMGAVGSATMTIAIIAAGLTAMILEIGDWRLEIGYYLLVGAVLLLLILALIFSPRLLRRWATVSHRLILISVGQSFIRLACWCVQLYLVLFALGGLGDLGILGNLGKTAIYYLLVTITPNVPIAEVGVRGSWAIVLFGSMNAALAGVLLWGINTLLPCLISLFFAKNNKTFA